MVEWKCSNINQTFCKMVAHMASPTGQNYVGDDSHYPTSGKTWIVPILTFNFCQILGLIVSQAGEHLLREDRHL